MVLLIIILIFILSVCGVAEASVNTTKIISIPTNESLSNNNSYEPSISADGRYIAFTSYANNLVLNDNNGFCDIFIRDNHLNTTKRISISNTGEEGNGNSFEPSISSNGRYVAFTSYATNLVPDDNNGFSDVFIYDLFLNITKLVSISSKGEQGNQNSHGASINGNGHFIAFTSFATNLVTDDTNEASDIFIRDMVSATTKRCSVSSKGSQGNFDSADPSISDDGQFISFTSSANNLVAEDSNECADIFVYNQLGGIEIVSISNKGEKGNYDSCKSSINGNGNYVSFISWADNLVDGDGDRWQDLFVYDRLLKKTERIAPIVHWDEGESFYGAAAISADGNCIAFVSRPFLIYNDLPIYIFNIFAHNRRTNTTEWISVSPSGEGGNYHSMNPSINADGSHIVFESEADNLVEIDTNSAIDIFLKKEYSLSLSGHISPELAKSGDLLILNASSNGANVTASMFENTLNLIKQPDGSWTLNCTVPKVPDGNYPVLLTAEDFEGSLKNLSLNFTVDNTPPSLSGNIIPNLVKLGGTILINVSSDHDTQNITALILNKTFNLRKQVNDTWDLNYKVPQISDGNYPILLTANDFAGNQVTTMLNFTVDNTPPVPTGIFSPNICKTGAIITLKVTSDQDTAAVTANILGKIYNMIKKNDGVWILQYAVPPTSDGIKNIVLTANDTINNQGIGITSFTVDNTPPTISGHIFPYITKPGAQVEIRVNASEDTKSVFAIMNNQKISLNYINELWAVPHTIPLNTSAGRKIVTLEVLDVAGNHGQGYVYYLVNAGGNSNGTTSPNSGASNPTGSHSSSSAHSDSMMQSGITMNSGSSDVVGSHSFGLVDILNLGGSLLNGSGKIISGDPPFYGSFESLLKAPWNPSSNYFQYLEGHYKYNGVKSPINDPIGFLSYIPDKFGEAWGKYQQTGNVWDFFDYSYIHIYGYSNLNNTWGGENIKNALNYLSIADPKTGNMSIGNLLILILTIIPISKLSLFLGKILIRYMPRALEYLAKSPLPQILLKIQALQLIFQRVRTHLINPLIKLGESILRKLPKYLSDTKLEDIGKGIIKTASILNLSPRTWVKTIFNVLSKFSKIHTMRMQKIHTKCMQLQIDVYNKLGLWGKLTSKDIIEIIGGSISTVLKGPKGIVDYLSSVFTRMTPSNVTKWLKVSIWRKEKFGWLKDVTGSKFYKDFQGTLGQVIKRNSALRSINSATRNVDDAIKKVSELAKNTASTLTAIVKNVAKPAKKIVKTVVKSIPKIIKKAAHNVKKVAKKVISKVKSAVGKVTKTVTKAVKKVQKTISSGINWLKNKLK